MRKHTCLWWMAAGILAALPARAADKRVCVEIVLQDESAKDNEEKPAPQTKPEEAPAAPAQGPETGEKKSSQPWDPPKRAPKKPASVDAAPPAAKQAPGLLPIGQTPVMYLKRLVEHFVTHEPGFESVDDRCEETLRVELYPLLDGWTVFARYSGTRREERVDQLHADELALFAERATLALLYDQPISTTINRENVLRADSKKSAQRIKGQHHFGLSVGTDVRSGQFDTAGGQNGDTSETLRFFSPMTLGLGYRGRFESWGVEALAALGLGQSRTGLAENSLGGHIDFGGNVGLTLNFLRYFNPRGLSSFYMGGGATFELLWFSAIIPAAERASGKRNTLFSGGLDAELVLGMEFMRASSVQFYLQLEAKLPAYVIETEDEHASRIKTWFPGLGLKLGVLF